MAAMVWLRRRRARLTILQKKQVLSRRTDRYSDAWQCQSCCPWHSNYVAATTRHRRTVLVWPMSRLAAKQADLFALQPTAESKSSVTDADARRIRLPSNLSASLKYVDNDELAALIHEGSGDGMAEVA
jgi:hypothetical protein